MRLATLNGAKVSIRFQKISFSKPGAGGVSNGQPLPVSVLTRNDGDRHTFNIADKNAYTGVSAVWLNTDNPDEASKKFVSTVNCPELKNSLCITAGDVKRSEIAK